MRFFLPLNIVLFLALMTFSQSTAPSVIDEFGSVNCEDYLARMDSVIIQAANNPNAKVFVLVYEGKIRRYIYDRQGRSRTEVVYSEFGLAKAKIRSMKKYLSVRGYGSRNFVFVRAGFREDFTVEIWLVPDGADKPVPRPTFTKIRYRKGKPSGFCLGCCG